MRFLIFFFLLTGINGISLSQTGFYGNAGKHTVRPDIIDVVLYNPGKASQWYTTVDPIRWRALFPMQRFDHVISLYVRQQKNITSENISF